MQKDLSFGKPETVCSSQEATGLMPAAVPSQEQQHLDDMEGIHAPAPKKKSRCCKRTRQEKNNED